MAAEISGEEGATAESIAGTWTRVMGERMAALSGGEPPVTA
jgi:hypothetical protein